VRELKAHFAATLAKVAAGHSATITSHGRPVAQLVPPPPTGDDLTDKLMAAGLLSERPLIGGLPARHLLPLPPGCGSVSDAVIEDRGW